MTTATHELAPTIPLMLPKGLIAAALGRAKRTQSTTEAVLAGCLHQGMALGYKPKRYDANVGTLQYMRIAITADDRAHLMKVARTVGSAPALSDAWKGYGPGVDEAARQFIEFGLTKRPPAGLPDPAAEAKKRAFRVFDIKVPVAVHEQLQARVADYVDKRTGPEAVRMVNRALAAAAPLRPSMHYWGAPGRPCQLRLPSSIVPVLEGLAVRHVHIEVSEVLRRLIIAGLALDQQDPQP